MTPQTKFYFKFSPISEKWDGWSWRTTPGSKKIWPYCEKIKGRGHGTVDNWTIELQANLPQIPLKPGVFLASKPHNWKNKAYNIINSRHQLFSSFSFFLSVSLFRYTEPVRRKELILSWPWPTELRWDCLCSLRNCEMTFLDFQTAKKGRKLTYPYLIDNRIYKE